MSVVRRYERQVKSQQSLLAIVHTYTFPIQEKNPGVESLGNAAQNSRLLVTI